MTTRSWKRRKKARPGEIVAAALHLFAERGYAATRLDDVAAAARVSKGTLYLYFANKEELFRAVVRETILPNLEAVAGLTAQHQGTTAELLSLVLRRLAGMLETDFTGVPKLILSEAGNFPSLAQFYVDTVVKRGLGLMAGILERGIAQGEFRRVDIATTLPLIVAPFLMMALFKHSLAPHTDLHFDRKAVIENHLDMLLRGLAAEAAP
jgi:AcrR family transcriptional regulator